MEQVQKKRRGGARDDSSINIGLSREQLISYYTNLEQKLKIKNMSCFITSSDKS